MKISKEQKKENKIRLLKATADLSQAESFKAITMKQIAKEAGLAEATIYNYFSTKEQIVFEYFSWRLLEAVEKLNSKSQNLAFSEVLQQLLENQLSFMEEDRGFVAEVFNSILMNPLLLANTDLKASKSSYIEFVKEKFQEAIGKGEFSAPPFEELLFELMWDFHIGAVYYWIKDDSKNSMRTTEMIELSLRMFDEILKSGMIQKVYSISHFLLKEHLLGKLFGGR